MNNVEEAFIKCYIVLHVQDMKTPLEILILLRLNTSVKFNPTNNAEVLTTGRDSIVKLTDVRKAGEELQSFYHSDFRIDLSYAACAISADGKSSFHSFTYNCTFQNINIIANINNVPLPPPVKV